MEKIQKISLSFLFEGQRMWKVIIGGEAKINWLSFMTFGIRHEREGEKQG
jgi:hypothetical protein